MVTFAVCKPAGFCCNDYFSLDVDLDMTFHFDADLDPDPDSAPHQSVENLKLPDSDFPRQHYEPPRLHF